MKIQQLFSNLFFFTALNLGNLQKKESVLIIEKIRDGWIPVVSCYAWYSPKMISLSSKINMMPEKREKERCSGSYCQAVGFLVIKDDSISKRPGYVLQQFLKESSWLFKIWAIWIWKEKGKRIPVKAFLKGFVGL